MALKRILIIALCVCLTLAVAFTISQISRQRMAKKIDELAAENEHLESARAQAECDARELRAALARLNEVLIQADKDVKVIEEAHDERVDKISELPGEWRNCLLPDGVCDMFSTYTLPRTGTTTDVPSPPMRAAGDP